MALINCKKDDTAGAIVVAGVGNPLLCDDTVGLYVVEEVRRRFRGHTGVQCIQVFSGGFDLIYELDGFTKAIIIDCVQAPVVRPGEIVSFSISPACPGPQWPVASSHGIDLAAAMSTGRACGYQMPVEVVVYGIGGNDCHSFSEKPTDGVAAAIGRAADLVAQDIESWLSPKELFHEKHL
jgi:hydrogenase maturation protease